MLVREGNSFSFIDYSAICGGAPSRGMTIKYKKKKIVHSALFIDSGTLTEMTELMRKEKESLTVKRRGRKRKQITPGVSSIEVPYTYRSLLVSFQFTVHPSNGGHGLSDNENPNEEDNEEEEIEENPQPSKNIMKKRASVRSPSPQLVSSGTPSPVPSPLRAKQTKNSSGNKGIGKFS